MVRTQPQERWNVVRELRRRVKFAFDGAGIEIPFPHRTVILHDASRTPPA
jgi:small conductance mechanosensitive channel